MVALLTRQAKRRGMLALCAALLLFLMGRSVYAAESNKKEAVLKGADTDVSRALRAYTPDTSEWRALAGDGAYSYGQAYYYSQASYYSYSQAYYYSQATYGIVITDSVSVTGHVNVIGQIQKGSGTFMIDHPLDPKNKLLYHSFVESPDVLNLYDGVVILDERGEADVELPDYFLALNKDFTYLTTPIGGTMPNLYIKKRIKRTLLSLYHPAVFTIAGGAPRGKVSWQVTGVRRDALIKANPIIPEVQKGPDQAVNVGEYIFPEFYESKERK